MKKIIPVIIFISIICPVKSSPGKIMGLTVKEFQIKQEIDLKQIKYFRKQLNSIITYINQRDDLFSQKKLEKPYLINIEKRREIRAIWKRFLDYYFALDNLIIYHSNFHKFPENLQNRSFLITYAAFITEFRIALEFINLAENNPALDTILNEPIPALGLKKGMYTNFKIYFINPLTASTMAVLNFYSILNYFPQKKTLFIKIDNESKAIWKIIKKDGKELLLKNSFDLLKKVGTELLFPIQKKISIRMGQTKIFRKNRYLITKRQLNSIGKKLEPGDIILVHRDWYLSNIGIPGYWTHAVLYIGTPRQRKDYFQSEDLNNWIEEQHKPDFETLLKENYPLAYTNSLKKHLGKLPRTIEALGKGVVFSPVNKSLAADSVAVIRPKLSKKEKAIALTRAFSMYGKKYDFKFDFISDNTVVCSELIYKSYEPGKEIQGLKFPLQTIFGYKLLPANSIAQSYAQNPDQQLEFILFYDSSELLQKSFKSNKDRFKKSWQRPKWHMFMLKE